MVAPIPDGRSASVAIELLVEERRFAVAQVGRHELILKNGAIVLPGDRGVLVVRVDGHEDRWNVTYGASTEPRQIVPAEFRASE